jgi:hypothetical protein
MIDSEARWALDNDIDNNETDWLSRSPVSVVLDDVCRVCDNRGLDYVPGRYPNSQLARAVCPRCGCSNDC